MENPNLIELHLEKFQTKYEHLLVTKCGRVFTKDRIKHSFSRGQSPYSCEIKGQELKTRTDKDGYLRFNSIIDKKHTTLLVHKLMAFTFLGDTPKGFVVDHIDRNKTNNKIENLRHATYKTNAQNSNYHKMTEEKKNMAIKMKKIGASTAAIARALNVEYNSIAYFFKSLRNV